MNETLELAEQYYAVARDLELQAQEYQRMAAFLNSRGDELCEYNMRQTPKPESVTDKP